MDLSRRAFVGTLAAGVPLAASTAFGLSPQTPAHVHPSPPSDAVLDHLLRQLVAVHNRVQKRAPTGEDGRAAAAVLTTIRVYAAQNGFDASVKKGIAGAVKHHGRDALMYLPADTAALRNELRRLGVSPGTLEFGRVGAPDAVVRRRALDGLLNAGASVRLDALATQMQRLGADADTRMQTAGLRRVQWIDGNCQALAEQIGYLEAEVAIVCGAAAIFPELAILCGLLSVTLGLELLYYYYWC